MISEPTLEKALREIDTATKKAASRKTGEASEKGFKRLDLRVPVIRAMVKTGYDFHRDLSRSEILKAWHFIFSHTDIFEVASQCIYYYQHKSLNRAEFNTVVKWIERCDCWEHSDDFSKIYAKVFEENPDWVMPWYKKWNQHKNSWKRRQSIVGLLEYAQKRKQVQSYTVLIEFIRPLLDDDEYYVQKGVGWTLREIYNLYPDKTLRFLYDNLARIDPLAYSAATEKLDKPTKAAMNKQRKLARPRKWRTESSLSSSSSCGRLTT
jgi:3-methyladenine DNA glycosylase AlkD